jgi:hypothetical protein
MLSFFRKRRRQTPPTSARRRIALETLESRNLFAALPLGATPADTAEFMLGRVAVVPVLFESNGGIDPSTENWTPATIASTLTKIREGLQWWVETLENYSDHHSLEFVIDTTFADTPVSTPYEPIARRSQDHETYVGDFLDQQGFGDAGSIEAAIRGFNHQARLEHQTDWAFTIFIVNSSNDFDGQFADGSEFQYAFAYPGGRYLVMPSTRPTSTVTHEVGHIFWARDEYPGAGSYHDRRGYYNAQNTNAAEDRPSNAPPQEPSIMRAGTALTTAFNNHYLPASTAAMIGWRDSDGDGVFDLADVPLSLEGLGWHDPVAGRFRFEGFASAVPLANQNSAGPQNDITLNRVERVEYRIDGGGWQTAMTLGLQRGEIEFQLAVGDFSLLEIRAVGDLLGVASPIYAMTGNSPLVAGLSVGGQAVLRTGGEGEVDPTREPFANVTAKLTRIDGPQPLRGALEPDRFSLSVPPTAPGVTLASSGPVVDGRVGSVSANGSTGSRAFGYFNRQTSAWSSAWAPDKTLQIRFDSPVGEVRLDAIGHSGLTSYGRLEAYDANNRLLTRSTTKGLAPGQVETLVVADVAGRIASVRAFGHASSLIALDNLRYGVPTQSISSEGGLFRFAGLPDGDYRLDLEPSIWTYQSSLSGQVVSIRNGVAPSFAAEFVRVRSPWTNPADRFDVTGDGFVEPLDALVVLNDIARWGNRILNNPAEITFYFDTNDDGRIEPLDALLVLNEIARRRSVGQGAAGEAAFAGDEASSQPPLTAAGDTPGNRKTPPKPGTSAPPFGWLAGFREEDERDRLFAGLGQQNAGDWLPGPNK